MEGTLRGSIADVLEGQISGSLELLAGEPVLEDLSVSSNGVYEPRTGVDGFDKVTVNVPTEEPELETLNVTQNGTYTPGSGVDGFDEVNVNVQTTQPVLDSIEINENGHYTPPSGTDGYDDITVYVPYVSQGTTIIENGTYTPPSGVDGFSQVIVDVPNTVQGLNVTENGTYTPPVGSGVVGYSPVIVDVTPPAPVTSILNVTHNGTFYPQSPSVGFSEVVVDVPQTEDIIFSNGVWTPRSDLTMSLYNSQIEDNKIHCVGSNAGVLMTTQSFTKRYYYMKFKLYNPNNTSLQVGRCGKNGALNTIIQSGTGRRSYTNLSNLDEDDYIILLATAQDDCLFIGGGYNISNVNYYITEISLQLADVYS